jgi:hypothetical protein
MCARAIDRCLSAEDRGDVGSRGGPTPILGGSRGGPIYNILFSFCSLFKKEEKAGELVTYTHVYIDK